MVKERAASKEKEERARAGRKNGGAVKRKVKAEGRRKVPGRPYGLQIKGTPPSSVLLLVLCQDCVQDGGLSGPGEEGGGGGGGGATGLQDTIARNT